MVDFPPLFVPAVYCGEKYSERSRGSTPLVRGDVQYFLPSLGKDTLASDPTFNNCGKLHTDLACEKGGKTPP